MEVLVNPQEIISANRVLISNLHRLYSFGGLFLYRMIILQLSWKMWDMSWVKLA
jgi:hypothetical protein